MPSHARAHVAHVRHSRVRSPSGNHVAKHSRQPARGQDTGTHNARVVAGPSGSEVWLEIRRLRHLRHVRHRQCKTMPSDENACNPIPPAVTQT
jgi:hypothetical protein